MNKCAYSYFPKGWQLIEKKICMMILIKMQTLPFSLSSSTMPFHKISCDVKVAAIRLYKQMQRRNGAWFWHGVVSAKSETFKSPHFDQNCHTLFLWSTVNLFENSCNIYSYWNMRKLTSIIWLSSNICLLSHLVIILITFLSWVLIYWWLSCLVMLYIILNTFSTSWVQIFWLLSHLVKRHVRYNAHVNTLKSEGSSTQKCVYDDI